MVEFELKSTYGFAGRALIEKLIMSFINHVKITILVEVMVFLKQDNVLASFRLLFAELPDSFKISLLKVFLLELHYYLVTFFQLSEPLNKYT